MTDRDLDDRALGGLDRVTGMSSFGSTLKFVRRRSFSRDSTSTSAEFRTSLFETVRSRKMNCNAFLADLNNRFQTLLKRDADRGEKIR